MASGIFQAPKEAYPVYPAYPVILSKKSFGGINRNERLFETLRTGRIIAKT